MKFVRVWLCALAIVSGTLLAGAWVACGGEMLSAEAARALADMDFARLGKILEAEGVSGEALGACEAMAKVFEAACRKVNDGSWRPTATELAGVPGRVKGVSASGVSIDSGGVTMVLPWRSVPAAKRLDFLAAGAGKGDSQAWLARVAYAAWSGLGAVASEEASQAAKEGVELPGFLTLAIGMLSGPKSGAEVEERSPDRAGPETARKKGTRAKSSGLLGSPDFYPSPERPVGWRGDWTGRYPGATPPVKWSRRVKGITSEIWYQADRPTTPGPGTGSHPLEYFTLKEWLVAGPFDVADPVKDIDKDFLGGEDKVQPSRGEKVGSVTWKHLRADVATQSTHYHNEGTCGHQNVDFVYCFSNLPDSGTVKASDMLFLNNKVAYAHTYIYSPAAAEVRLRVVYTAAAARVFLNGRPVAVQSDREVKVSLAQGWNRLLLKASCGKAAVPEGQNLWVSRWRIAAYLEPVLPVSYQTRNIAWMTRMTGRSMSQPIVVGDRIYIGSGMTDLICLDKKTGRILWLQSNTPYDAMSEKERADPRIKEQVAPLAAKLAALNRQVVEAINAAVSPSGMATDEQAKLDALLKAKADAERAVHDAFRAIDRNRYPPMYLNEVSSSNATPTSDGERVWWVCGGGMKGPGSHVVACFDLDGRRLWSWHDGGSLGSLEHGNHMSPTLVDGKLIYSANMHLLAFDALKGNELWRNTPNDWQNAGHGSNSPVVVRLGGQAAILQLRYIHRASDGTVICPSKLDIWGCSTPIVENGIVYNPCSWRGWNDPLSFMAIRLPASTAAGAKAEVLMELDGKDVTMPLRMPGPVFTVASPLYVDGVVYSVEAGGGLAAVDVGSRKALYRQHLDGYNRYNRYVYGVCASPAYAGGHIYIVDDAGYTHVIEPGPKFKEVARNVLENIHLSGLGGNPCHQESFYTSPYFDGDAMYLRGEEYLYCIKEK